MRNLFAAEFICGTDFNGLKTAQHIQRVQRQAGNSAHTAGMAHNYAIEPAYAASASGYRAVFMPFFPNIRPISLSSSVGKGPSPTRVV